MLSRRRFLQLLGALPGLGGAAASPLTPSSMVAVQPRLRVALVADAHLPDGDPETEWARRLRTVFQEIDACHPPVDLLILAGDLTAAGNPAALKLGRDLLAGLKCPWLLLPGEHDLSPDGAQWWPRLFGPTRFSFFWRHCHFLGCDLAPPSAGGGFRLTSEHLSWLQEQLRDLSPDQPLFLITHAPLYRLYRPWGWWTCGSEALWPQLTVRPRVYLFHGHVHQSLALTFGHLRFQGLAPLAWTCPDPRQGLPAPAPDTFLESETLWGWQLLEVFASGEVHLQLRLRRTPLTRTL